MTHAVHKVVAQALVSIKVGKLMGIVMIKTTIVDVNGMVEIVVDLT